MINIKRQKNKKTRALIVLFILQIFFYFDSYSTEKKKSNPTITIKGTTVFVEIADSEKTRKKGLMGRSVLDKNSGMLFIYADSAVRYFWMKNTYVALDMAFIDSNMVIKTLHTADAVNDSTILYSSYVPVKYVLEVNRGWFEEHNVHTGDTVTFDKNPLPEGD